MEQPYVAQAVFYLRNRRLMLILCPLVALLSFALFFDSLAHEEPAWNWLMNFILWIYLSILALRRRLVLTSTGLEYTELITTASYRWNQVTGLVTRKTLGLWFVEGLLIRMDALDSPERFLDLRQFSRTWRQEELGAILQDRAPHLFQ